jgi:two-component system heavy metal sensor histidine kinase CusS
LQNRLAMTIGASVLGGAVLTIVTAVYISRHVTRPLLRTAEVIGSVDDAHLDRRIDAAALPVELRPMVGRLNQMLDRLEEAFRRQTHFLADAAHELRTPVAALRAGLEIALSKPRSAEHLTHVLERALRDTVQFGSTVEVMLECVRSGNEQHAAATDFDLVALLETCLDQARPLADQRGDTLHGNFPAALSVHAEAAPLRTTIWNLLSNALAHTPAGGTVAVSAREAGTDVIIEVSDTGQGIPTDQLGQIFEPFYRVDPSHGHSHHLGLGLYLVKRHVGRMGGTLAVESVLGTGTSFRVTLPRGLRARNVSKEGQSSGETVTERNVVNTSAS